MSIPCSLTSFSHFSPPPCFPSILILQTMLWWTSLCPGAGGMLYRNRMWQNWHGASLGLRRHSKLYFCFLGGSQILREETQLLWDCHASVGGPIQPRGEARGERNDFSLPAVAAVLAEAPDICEEVTLDIPATANVMIEMCYLLWALPKLQAQKQRNDCGFESPSLDNENN